MHGTMKKYTILYNGHQFISDNVRKENNFILNSLQKDRAKIEFKIPIT